VRLRLLFSIFALSSLAFAGTFDKPASKRVVDLGPSRSNPPGRNAKDQTRAKVTCYYFSGFMVKEVDMGEKGAERLAIVPIRKNEMRTCSRLRDPGEREINSDDWSGYFMGVKGRLVFFSADDGWNGGTGFAIFDSRTAKKIFDDVALGNLEFSDAAGSATSLRYTRVVDGGCIIPKEQSACWDKIKSKLALGAASMPDCKGGYEKSAQDLAKGRCQAQNTDNAQCVAKEIALAQQQTGDASSVIAYPVEVTLGAGVSIKPAQGDLRCWPSD
jgi:hypothetical protein